MPLLFESFAIGLRSRKDSRVCQQLKYFPNTKISRNGIMNASYWKAFPKKTYKTIPLLN